MKSNQNAGTVLLRGVVSGLTKRRAAYSAVFTDADKQAMERTAIAAALVGLNDIALNLSNSTQFTDTVADLVSFDLNGEQIRAWIWLSVFENGDEVEVVAERAGSEWVGYAIRRCSDGILSIHPHCERGSKALRRFFLKWSVFFWSVCALVPTLFLVFPLPKVQEQWIFLAKALLGIWAAIEIMAIFIAYRISSRFGRQLPMANKIFLTFGWKNAPNVDLPKISKKLKQSNDTWQMGKLIFRYNES